VGIYLKVVCAKLYVSKIPINVADLLSDRVLLLFAENRLSILRILTDRGIGYYGKAQTDDYQFI